MKKAVFLLAILLIAAGCRTKKEGGRGFDSQNNVEKVLAEKTAESETNEEAVTERKEQEGEEKQTREKSGSAVDYDLPAMGRRMVYATVNQMMINPEEYEGKTVRMQGAYYGVWDETMQQYYHYCIIQDATECCAQGIEFVWGDGSHAYPAEYPEMETEVVVTGVFETYTEEDGNFYCRLKDSTLEIAE